MNKVEVVFQALKSLHDGQYVGGSQNRLWLDALKAIGWAIEGDGRATLTGEGLNAFQEMLAERQKEAGRC